MINNASGRPGATESVGKRPEPREPAAPAMTRVAEVRAAEIRAAEARSAETRVPEAPRAVEVRVQEPAPAPRASVLGPTLRFKGELSAQEDLIVQGSVEGSITHTQSLTIGIDGLMKGDIRARVIIIDGKVEGDLYATESVSIRVSAKVKGNVFAPRAAISDGAFFQGRIEMQPSGAAVQEHSARQRQAALAAPVEGGQVDPTMAKA